MRQIWVCNFHVILIGSDEMEKGGKFIRSDSFYQGIDEFIWIFNGKLILRVWGNLMEKSKNNS